MSGRQGHRGVEVGDVEQVVPRDLFGELGERSVRDELLAVADPHGDRLVGRTQPGTAALGVADLLDPRRREPFV